MSTKCIPGTVLPLNNETSMMFSNIDVLFSAAKGLSLSQITSITGLPASTIQNWVKRGWISMGNGKKYNESAFSRILIINRASFRPRFRPAKNQRGVRRQYRKNAKRRACCKNRSTFKE
ncbi:MAG: DUF1836 domain-containing protein [Clostridia bacterium]|nr:DUF1836 domain-containing protein [Clostridia bacterium]